MSLNGPVNMTRWMVLLVTSITFDHLVKADENCTGIYLHSGKVFHWPNESQLLQMRGDDSKNNTLENFRELLVYPRTLGKSSIVGQFFANTRNNEQIEYPSKDRQYGRIVCMVLLVHIDTMTLTLTGPVNVARLLLVTSIALHPLVKADENFMDFDWPNETQLLQMHEYESENNTGQNSSELYLETLVDSSIVGQSVANTTNNGQIEFPSKNLGPHRHYARFVFMVLLLHIAVVGVGITIYSCVYCKFRTLKRRSRREAQRRLQMTNLRTEHIPNSRDCPCHGCILAREMLQGLIMQQLQELAEC